MIYFEASDNGLILVDGNDPIKKIEQEVSTEEEIKAVEAIANEDFEFEKWTKNGKDIPSGAVLNAGDFEPEDKDTFTAVFRKVVDEAVDFKSGEPNPSDEEQTEKIITVTYVAGKGGIVLTEEEKIDVLAEKIEALGSTATPDEGYVFVNWTDADGNEIISETITIEDLQLSADSEDMEFTANFKLDEESSEVGLMADRAAAYSVTFKSGETEYKIDDVPEGTLDRKRRTHA